MKNRQIERVWLTYSFLDEFILVYPVYAIMMLASDIDAFELSMLFAFWSLSVLLFEIPSGVVGDLVNRKAYVCIGSLIRAGGFLLWLLYPSLPGFALGFMLWGLGSAIHSGTLQSLLHDALAEQDCSSEFARIYGRGKTLESLAVLMAMALGGFVADSGYTMVLLLSVLAPLGAGLVIFFGIEEPVRTHEASKAEGFYTTLRTGIRTLLASRSLLMIAVMFIAFMGLSGVVDEYLGPILAEPGTLSLGLIGVLYGGILGARAIGTALAHRLRDMGLRRIGLISGFAYAVLLLGQAGNIWWLAGCWSVCFAVMGAVEVLLETNLQQEIQVAARATITSVAGAGLEVWGICLFLVIGGIASRADWALAIGVVAALSIAVSLGLAYAAGPVAARSRS